MDDDTYEIIRGKKFKFHSATPEQNQIRGRITVSIMKYLMEHKNGYIFGNVGVWFDDENIFFDDDEKAELQHEVPVKILDGLKIPLKYIFKWVR